MSFDGDSFDPEWDEARLKGQLGRVFALMRDGEWRTLREIATGTQSPEASISARLRDFRKPKNGGFLVEARRKGNPYRGLHEYRLLRRVTLDGLDATPP